MQSCLLIEEAKQLTFKKMLQDSSEDKKWWQQTNNTPLQPELPQYWIFIQIEAIRGNIFPAEPLQRWHFMARNGVAFQSKILSPYPKAASKLGTSDWFFFPQDVFCTFTCPEGCVFWLELFPNPTGLGFCGHRSACARKLQWPKHHHKDVPWSLQKYSQKPPGRDKISW